MIEHPGDDVLVAFADGEARAGTEDVAAHVATCVRCRQLIAQQQDVRRWLATAPTPVTDRATSNWQVVNERILARTSRRRRWNRFAVGAALAAGLIIVAVLAPWRVGAVSDQHAREGALLADADSVARAAAELRRFVSTALPDLPPTHQRAVTAVVDGVDEAIARTMLALDRDPSNEFLRDHLAELTRKRVIALSEVAELLRSRT